MPLSLERLSLSVSLCSLSILSIHYQEEAGRQAAMPACNRLYDCACACLYAYHLPACVCHASLPYYLTRQAGFAASSLSLEPAFACHTSPTSLALTHTCTSQGEEEEEEEGEKEKGKN